MHRLIILFLVGCAQVTSLNLQKHQFGQLPSKIVWMQLPGLSEEHIAMIKYSLPNSEIKTELEKALCIGKSWEYNLYSLRPSPYEGLLSQLTGKKNIKGSCEDYKQRPVWSYLLEKNYKVGIFETRTRKADTLLKANSCSEGKDYLKDTYFWKMAFNTPEKSNLYHQNETGLYEKNKVYYDRSCKTGDCFSSIANNIATTFSQFSRNAKNYLYLIRDFEFNYALESKEPLLARKRLQEVEKVIKFFREYTEKNNDFLLIITSAHTKNVSFPRQGSEWASFEKNGKFIQNKKSQLLSPVFVYGARAENFCGIYDQNDILARMFSGAKKQGLEFTILNPFAD